jgi:CBS domain-containing protein
MTASKTHQPDLRPPRPAARVVDAMSLGVLACPAWTPADAVARKMATHRIHAVVVEGLAGDAWGVVSDMDLVRTARGEVKRLTAGEIAATEPLQVEATLPLDEAVRLMAEHDVSHLIVTDAGRPVGMLSSLDVAAIVGAS